MKSTIADFDVLEWDEGWHKIVSAILIADHNLRQWNGEKMSEHNRLDRACEKAQTRYEKYAIEYPICKLHAERLIENLGAKFPKFEFAAHQDILSGGWGLLARKQANGKPPASSEWGKLSAIAGKIMSAVEEKHLDMIAEADDSLHTDPRLRDLRRRRDAR